MADKYPKRPRFWANRVSRLMAKSCAAQTIGPDGCWLVSIVAGVEDAKRYTGPVAFFNEQILPIAGFGSRSTLVRARDRAVAAGWLHYEAGGKGRAGLYWSTVPAELEDGLDDTPIDETPDEAERTQNGQETDNSVPQLEVETDTKCRTDLKRQTETENGGGGGISCFRSVRQTDGKCTANEHHSYLPLSLPLDTEQTEAKNSDPLTEWVEWWNGLHDRGLVHASVRSSRISSGLRTAWKRVERSKELRELLEDREALASAIAKSDFVRGGWFTLPKLLGGRNRAGEYICEVLKAGGYCGTGNQTGPGPGQRYQPGRGGGFGDGNRIGTAAGRAAEAGGFD